jgi:hypothetical protein
MLRLSLAVLPLLLQSVAAAPGALPQGRSECDQQVKTVTVYVNKVEDVREGGPTAAANPLKVDATLNSEKQTNVSPAGSNDENQTSGFLLDGVEDGFLADPYPTPIDARPVKGSDSSGSGSSGSGITGSSSSVNAASLRNVVYFPNWCVFEHDNRLETKGRNTYRIPGRYTEPDTSRKTCPQIRSPICCTLLPTSSRMAKCKKSPIGLQTCASNKQWTDHPA